MTKEEIEKSKDLLLKFGFTQMAIHSFQKYCYNAVIWANGDVTLTKYTPNFKRFVWSETYNPTDLEVELERHHYHTLTS